ncbi:MAG: prepilin-type N-terminal cleavage/methylation domain-containing protein [Halioglobus sp.]
MHSSDQESGFSLLELLVVLFVIVMIAASVNLNVSSGGQYIHLETEIRNLANVAAFSMDEAELSGRDYGLLVSRDFDAGEAVFSYSWRERLPQGWRSIENARDVFELREFPAGFELLLELDDVPVPDWQPAEGLDATPQVVLYASGETTPGSLEVMDSAGVLQWRLEWDLLGRFDLYRRGERDEAFDD